MPRCAPGRGLRWRGRTAPFTFAPQKKYNSVMTTSTHRTVNRRRFLFSSAAAATVGIARGQTPDPEKMKRIVDELTFGKNLGENEKTELVKSELARRGK